MTTNASRAPVDLDSLAAGAAPRPGGRPDPLAELARIVGQDDPFRALLEAQSGGRPAPRGPRIEPAFHEPAPQPVPHAAPRNSYEPAPALRGGLDPEEAPADAFHRYLAEVEQETAHGAAPQDGADFEAGYAPVPERPRGRRRLMMVGAGLGACVVAVAGVMTLKSPRNPRGPDGGPLLVMADKAPLKVAPQDAGGVEIPDQNKQIYERKAKDGQVRIVNREEQPLDVNQVARAAEAAAPQVPASAPSVATATPAGANALQDSLGEPRRVRTVSVRPEAPPFAREAQAAQDARPAAAPPAMVLPDAAAGTVPAPRSPRPVQAAATAAAPVTAPAAASTEASRPRVAVQRVATALPDSLPEATASTEAPASQAASGGGFAVQLAVRPSESEARAAYKQLQERFGANLAGRQPMIRQAEVNGKSIYRIRVGPMAREEANGLCTKLQGAGGQCFVAKN